MGKWIAAPQASGLMLGQTQACRFILVSSMEACFAGGRKH